VHFLPEYAQARKALWDMVNPHTGKRRIEESFPGALIETMRDHEMFIKFKNGSTWQLAGSDNYNAIVGTSFVGMAHSEYALADPSAQSYFSPMLRENGGWEAFITTPRGKNHAHRMFKYGEKQQAAGKDWFAQRMTVGESKAVATSELQEDLEQKQALYGEDFGRSLWLQEWYCEWDASVPGSIWGDCLDRAQREARIGVVPIEPGVAVFTAWDLGWTDQTAIWWFQIALGAIRVVDYYEGSFKEIPVYAQLLREKAKERGFRYGQHWLPHDARARTVAAGGKSIQQQMVNEKVGDIRIAPRLDHVDGIQAARATFPHVWIDSERCEKGIEILRSYCYEWDEEKRTFSTTPKHDFASHGASAWRTLALSWKPPKGPPKPGQLPASMEQGSIGAQSFGAIRERHFRKMRAARSLHL
jgi:hypothetical protein